MDSWIPKPLSMGVAGATLANALALGTLGLFIWLDQHDSDLFYQAVQEDEWLEWGTFWGFLLAAGAFFVAALAQRRRTSLWPWFLVGVGLFCFVVGMEEISWGQRVIGYRPPSYFLAHNTQQELNVHNVMKEDFRMLGVKLVILGYGVGLPILALIPQAARALAAVGVVAPPVELVPSFAAAYWTYHDYPFKFAGEVTEFMLALGFLFAGLTRWRECSEPARKPAGLPAWIAAGAALMLVLGAANAWASRAQREASPENLEAARTELAALARDFVSRASDSNGQLPTKCGLHKRLYTYRREYHHEFLASGQFAALQQKGLPEERAEFLLDPWNSPYWIRDKCTSDGRRRSVFLYSFGPNRRRDSTAWEFGGDDPGLVLLARRNHL